MEPLDNVLSRLNAQQSGKQQWDALCPCRNDDENPSLRVSVGKHGQVLLKCLRGGGCDLGQICESIGLTTADLFPKETKKIIKKNLKHVATYEYVDANSQLVMEVLRYVDEDGKKTFRQRRPSENGGWDWSTSNIEKPLYRLPQVLAAKKEGRPIYVVEGEKDVHTLESLGKTATTNPGGAGGEGQNKWLQSHTNTLAGANVIIIADNDNAGIVHAKAVAKTLTEAGCKVKTFKPANHKDVSDMINAGETLAEGLEPLDPPEVNATTSEPVADSALKALITTLQGIDETALSETVVAGRIASSFSTYFSKKEDNTQSTGHLVEWSPFLEEDADISYDWVIPHVLERQERVIVVAAEGAGKTTLARQVALMSSAGIHPFRRDSMPPVRTLMIDLENPERIIRRTSMRIYDEIRWHKKHKNMDAHLLMKPDGVNLLLDKDKAIIEEHIATIKPDILFFGPLYKSFIDPGGRTAESVSIEIVRFLDYIRSYYNCALWVEHHAPLGSGGQRDLRPFGSAVWSRWSEFGIALAPDPTDPELIEFRHYRGQREAREWPAICKRGTKWPFEVVEFSSYTSSNIQQSAQSSNSHDYDNEEFDNNDMSW